MAPFRPLIDLLAQLWFAVDTASALRHGNTVSPKARAYCMNEAARASSAPASSSSSAPALAQRSLSHA